MTNHKIAFEEAKCAIGGCFCAAWNDWYWSSIDADPEAAVRLDDEDFSPTLLSNFPFDPDMCEGKDKCDLYRQSLAGNGAGETPSKTLVEPVLAQIQDKE